MKKLLPLGFLLALATACSDEGGDAIVELKYLPGNWKPLSLLLDDVKMPYDGDFSCGKDYLEFMEGYMVKITDVTGCNGSSPVTEIHTGTYDTTDLKLTLDTDTNTPVYDIAKLSRTRLHLSYTGDWDGDHHNEAITIIYMKMD